MKIPVQRPGKDEEAAELFVVGNSLALEYADDVGKLTRIGPLTPSQWRLLAKSAEDRAGKER